MKRRRFGSASMSNSASSWGASRRGGEGERVAKTREPVSGLKWTRIAMPKSLSRKPEKCDVCLREMMSGGRWKAPGVAVYRRSKGKDTLLLCWEHTVEQRQADGLKAPKRGAK